MIGVIAKISDILSSADISIFVASTYNTDHVLLKCVDFEQGVKELKQQGYVIEN